MDVFVFILSSALDGGSRVFDSLNRLECADHLLPGIVGATGGELLFQGQTYIFLTTQRFLTGGETSDSHETKSKTSQGCCTHVLTPSHPHHHLSEQAL